MTRYWFRPKRYGYGATPMTWEGWAVIAGFAGLLAASIVAMQRLAGPGNLAGWLVWAVFLVIGVWWFVQFTRRRTEGEWRWRWGREN